jgi:beta-lactamase regulating signal transducer with metallopeptidase domain
VGPVFRGHAAGSNSAPGVSLPESWATCFLFLWAAFASFALARILIGFLQVVKLRRSCVAVSITGLDPILQKTLSDGAHRKAVLCVSSRLQVPTALGFFRPLIAIPAWAMEELSVTELNAILIHELAHVRRWDDWTNLLQKVVRAVFFFHPAAWWIDRQLSLEREMACDDEVLSRTENPKAYARCLVSVAEKSFLRRGFVLAQAAVNHVRQTSLRVSQILDRKRSGATRVWKPALYATATLAMASLVVSGQMPELITFRDSHSLPLQASTNTTPVSSTMAVPHPSRELPSAKVAMAKYVPTGMRQKSSRLEGSKMLAANLPAARSPQPEESFGGVALPATDPAPGAGSMLIFVHQQEYNAQGSMFWAVYVWRVTLQSSNPARLEKAPPAKTT